MNNITRSNSVAVQLFGSDSIVTTRHSTAGKYIGDRVAYGQAPASEVRAAFKAEGFKGNNLTKAVNEVINGNKDFAWAKHDAAVSALRSKGFVPDYTDVSAKGNGALTRYTKPVAPAERPVVTKSNVVELFKSMSAEDRAALLAALQS